MKIYSVSNNDCAVTLLAKHNYQIRSLYTFGLAGLTLVRRASKSVKDLIIDSGAYGFYKKGIKHPSIPKYCQFIDDIKADEHGKRALTAYFNMDVIGDERASKKNWLLMRDMGYDPMPVWHVGTDTDVLKYYCEHTDYVAIGGLVGTGMGNPLPHLDKILREHVPKETKIHLLGVGNVNILYRFCERVYSCDSSTFIHAAKNSCVTTVQANGKPKRFRPNNDIHVKNDGRFLSYNLLQYIKLEKDINSYLRQRQQRNASS